MSRGGKTGGFAPLSALELAYFAFVKDFREHLPQYRDLGYLERWCTLVGSAGQIGERILSIVIWFASSVAAAPQDPFRHLHWVAGLRCWGCLQR
jgi:hypothetical protein